MLAFPSAWVSFEYLLNLVSPHGTVGNLAYTQLNFLPVLQLASVTGPWGISFVLLLFSAALAIGLHARVAPAIRTMGVGLGVVMLVLICGTVRLLVPVRGEAVRVGLIASDQPGNTHVADDGAQTPAGCCWTMLPQPRLWPQRERRSSCYRKSSAWSSIRTRWRQMRFFRLWPTRPSLRLWSA